MTKGKTLIKVHIPHEMAQWLEKEAEKRYPMGRGKSNIVFKALERYRQASGAVDLPQEE